MPAGLSAIALALACGAPVHAADDPAAAARAPATAVLTLVGDAACDDDSQCKTLAMGAKACGGPEYYLAWSTKRTDAVALRQATERELTAQRNMLAGPRMNSNCVFVTDPGAYCARVAGQGSPSAQGGSCRLRGGDRGGSGRVD